MGLLDRMFGGGKRHDPYKAAAPWLQQQRNTLQPYVQQGQRVGNLYEQTAGQMAQNPQEFINQLMNSYQQSPAFERQRDDALGAMQNSAAAGGMVGSPADQEHQGQLASSLASEDMMKWLHEVLGAQGTGLNAQQDIYGKGYGAAGGIANSFGSNAGLAYGQAQQKNQAAQDKLTGILKLLGGAGAAAFSGGGMGNTGSNFI